MITTTGIPILIFLLVYLSLPLWVTRLPAFTRRGVRIPMKKFYVVLLWHLPVFTLWFSLRFVMPFWLAIMLVTAIGVHLYSESPTSSAPLLWIVVLADVWLFAAGGWITSRQFWKCLGQSPPKEPRNA